MNQMSFDFPYEGETVAERTIRLLESLLKHRVDIENALEYNNNSHTFDDVCRGVIEGRYHFYPLENSCIVMEIINYPQYSVYHVFIAGGNKEEIQNVHPWMADQARALGCKYCSVTGRPGWGRELKKYGWKHKMTTLFLEL